MLLASLLLFTTTTDAALQMPLRQAASGSGIFVGAALNQGYLKSDSTYAKVGAQQYNLVTAENACKWASTEPQENQFDFSGCDYIYNFAKTNNMTFRGHNLCWGEYNPSWLTNGNFNADQLKQFLQTHIQTVIAHYPNNEAYAWDVVNEAISDSPTTSNPYKNNVWYPAIPNYVQLAFEYASNAIKQNGNSNVKLFYNDYNILGAYSWESNKINAVYNMIVNIKNAGVKIDGIGFQAHLDTNNLGQFDYNSVVKNFERFANLGLEIHVTELDTKDSSNNQGTEAQMYGLVLKACMAVKNCKSFESWGYTDKYTWLGSNQYPLPFDSNYNPKQAAYTIEQMFLNRTSSSVQ